MAAYTAESPSVAKIPGVNKTILAAAGLGLRWGYAESYHSMFYLLLAFGLLATAICAALPNMSRFMTDKVVAPARRMTNRRNIE